MGGGGVTHLGIRLISASFKLDREGLSCVFAKKKKRGFALSNVELQTQQGCE